MISKKPSVIIDMGCGSGLNLRIIRNYVDGLAFLIGVDKDASALSIVKILATEVGVIQANIYALPLRSNVIDLIFCASVVHELPNLEALDEVRRVLKHRGRLLLSVVVRYVLSWILDLLR